MSYKLPSRDVFPDGVDLVLRVIYQLDDLFPLKLRSLYFRAGLPPVENLILRFSALGITAAKPRFATPQLYLLCHIPQLLILSIL